MWGVSIQITMTYTSDFFNCLICRKTQCFGSGFTSIIGKTIKNIHVKCTMLDPLEWRVSDPAVGRFYYGVEKLSDRGSSRIL